MERKGKGDARFRMHELRALLEEMQQENLSARESRLAISRNQCQSAHVYVIRLQLSAGTASDTGRSEGEAEREALKT